MAVKVQADNFDLAAELKNFGRDAGAVVTLTGLVRNRPDGTLDHMLIEHYPAMTLSALTEIETQACARWALTDTLIIHRYGELRPGAQIMMVATASLHRAEAFAAAEFLMDYLKSRAPFWKKEVTSEGESWVAAADRDEEALKRW